MPLLRVLGVAFGVAVVIGTTIGAGILRTPGAVVAQVGSAWVAVLVWAFGGAFAVMAAAALADLATSMPHSGGFYVYAQRALGASPAVSIGLADWLSNCSAVAYAAVTFGEYVGRFVPAAAGHPVASGAVIIVGFSLVHLAGIRTSSRIQEAASFVKALAFGALIVGLLAFAPAASTTGATAAGPVGIPGLLASLVAMQLVLGAYDGWQGAMYFAGEDRDPERNLPRAFIGGTLLVVVVYVLLNVALLRVLPVATMAGSTLPAADAGRILAGQTGEMFITALALFSPLALVSAVLLCASRILHAIANDGLLPRGIASVSSAGTPALALGLSMVAALLVLTTGSFDAIASVFACFTLVGYAGAFVSLLVLRQREPELPRPFRVWGHPWSTGVLLAVSVALLAGVVVSSPAQSAAALGVLVVGWAMCGFSGMRAS